MANRFIDSVQHYSTVNIAQKYTFNSGATVVPASSPRGTATLAFSNWSHPVGLTIDDQATWIVGFRIKFSGGLPLNVPRLIWNLFDGLAGSSQLQLILTTDSRLAIRAGDNTTILATAPANALQNDVWYFVEWKSTIDSVAGESEVHLNNSSIGLSFSGDTQNTANPSASQHRIIDDLNASVAINICDVYINDGTGGADDDYWNDTEIDYLAPDENGPVVQYTPVGSAINFENVDELTPNTANYNESNTVGNRDLYGFPTISGTPTIKCIQSVGYMSKDDGNDRRVQLCTRSGGVDYDGTIQDVPASSTYLLQRWPDDPDTSADWTAAGANAAFFGALVEN